MLNLLYAKTISLSSLFSGVEIMDLMSDLGAYASLLYTAALTGAMKIVYTIVVAFALMASLHGVHTRAIIILDMQEVSRCMYVFVFVFENVFMQVSVW